MRNPLAPLGDVTTSQSRRRQKIQLAGKGAARLDRLFDLDQWCDEGNRPERRQCLDQRTGLVRCSRDDDPHAGERPRSHRLGSTPSCVARRFRSHVATGRFGSGQFRSGPGAVERSGEPDRPHPTRAAPSSAGIGHPDRPGRRAGARRRRGRRPAASIRSRARRGTARSVVTRAPRRRVVDRSEQRTGASSSLRHSIATQPWPTAGTNTSVGRSPRSGSVSPRTSSAATAITIAPPSGIFDRRVWMLPRSSTNCEVGAHRGAAAPAGGPTRWRPSRPGGDRRGWSRRARRGIAPRRRTRRCVRPSAAVDGRSLAECAARSARPSSTARCTSLTNTPCPPIVCSGTSWRWSPGRLDEHQLGGRTPGGRRSMRCGDELGLRARLRAGARRDPQVARHRAASRHGHGLRRGRTGRAPRRRCARPAACRRRPSAAPTAGAAAWRRCPS